MPRSPRPESLFRSLRLAGSAFRQSRAHRPRASAFGDEAPLRAELFSREQLASHGGVLAGAHRVSPHRRPDGLLGRLAENEAALTAVRDLLTAAVNDDRRITPAGEWLLDNFYLIEEQIRTARRHLPPGYSRQLPRLADGPSAGLPRVYDVALETISHRDGRLDTDGLGSFVDSYQAVTPLTLGELWALPIMLRLALLENLRRVAARMGADRLDRNRADGWADRMVATAEQDPKSLILVIADMARSDPPMVGSFVAEFARRLQGKSPALALPLTWIEQRLSEEGLTIEQLIRVENQQQAADQVSISNSISSLRLLGAADWRAFVEARSGVEATLREDPSGDYSRMDFATRDAYRHVVEAAALHSGVEERAVAQRAIDLARETDANAGSSARMKHVGYYLVDEGLERLERAVGARYPLAGRIRRACLARPLLLYLGSVVLLTVLPTAGLVVGLRAEGGAGWLTALLTVLLLVCASQVAVALVNALVPRLATPRALPKLDLSSGVPAASRTLVVVPTMLGSAQAVEQMVEALEVRFLGNRDPRVSFGLLTDLADSSSETLPGDDALTGLAEQRIVELNRKYPGDPFFLFHRPRRWNPEEGLWMGYERKRGKLAELNALLRGVPPGRFARVVGDTAILPQVKYVITLDADTQLPRDAARQLVGAMMHPLNRPTYDAAAQRVTTGYGILQPRVAVSLPSAGRSRYARLWASEPGIDPYTRVVSDVYQDLFGEGSFIGKGVYDVDAFTLAVGSRFPENRILSHDLLEGCYARAGLATDLEVYEDYPSRYEEDVRRRARWIRGDWQLWRWILPAVPGPDGRRVRNPLPVIGRWKLFDNLRRSLVPGALVALFVLAWAALSPAWGWTLAAVGSLLVPVLVAAVPGIIRKPTDMPLARHLGAGGRSLIRQLAQALLALACLPYEAWFSLDAAVRATVRLTFTHRRLLEWTPSGDRAHRPGDRMLGAWTSMWTAPGLAVATATFLSAVRPESVVPAAPILLLWVIAPAMMWLISRPLAHRAPRLTAAQRRFLGGVARSTWSFFDTQVGADDHWLPPDNCQESPPVGVAHRTSPTNMGLALLANLSAFDLGYISAGRLLDRTARAFEAMSAMERHRGHFFNWYDTRTLAPLEPRYISTVDSGNLAGHLLTLRQGLLGLVNEPVVPARVFEGLRDTLELAAGRRGGVPTAAMTTLQAALDRACESPPGTIEDGRLTLERLVAASDAFVTELAATGEPAAGRWALQLAGQCREVLADVAWLAPRGPLPAPQSPAEPPTDAAVRTLGEQAALDGAPAEPARSRLAAIHRLAAQAVDLADVEWAFLFDEDRKLLTIGYNVADRRCDSSYYDLLASEARLATFVGIAQGRLPQESWFALGRLLTTAAGQPVLVSWSGSMFEYLMPLVVMPRYDDTLLDQTCRAAVRRQMEYGRHCGVPWGISESGYNALDARLTYQYRAFGVPGLGLKRGLRDDVVVAPYASALALMVLPEEACVNLQRLADEGFAGDLGFYEAIDYTPARLPRGHAHAVVRSYMAHHQGMAILSLAHALVGQRMQHRFTSDPALRAATLLLHERIPRATALSLAPAPASDARALSAGPEVAARTFTGPDTASPEVQLLSNGRYHVMITTAGGGYSRWKDLAVTRWREDPTRDNWGSFCYVRDLADGAFWSTAHQPTLQPVDRFEVVFSESRAEFRSTSHATESYTEVAVSPEDDVELRRLRLTNCGRTRRTLEVTSYAEVVLAVQAADDLHPAFSNLFVQTEVVPDQRAILCTRRPRSRGEPAPWMFHLMAAHGEAGGSDLSFETERMRFIGRGRTPADPRALREGGPLSGTQGSVLDPIVAIRGRFTLAPDESVTIDFVTGVAETRAEGLGLVSKYQDRRLANRVFALASTHARVVLRQLNASEADAQLYCRLAGSVIYTNPSLRADAATLVRNRRGQSGLWGYSVSGDLPIVLLQLGDASRIELARQLVQAHAYWRLKGLPVDLMIWNEDRAGYRQQLQEQLVGLIAAGVEANAPDRPGAIFVRPADQISTEDRVLFQSVARAIITDGRGALEDQVGARRPEVQAPTRLTPSRIQRRPTPAPPSAQRTDLVFFNGLGGFTPDGREYIVTTAAGAVTPAPWVNVLANPEFGTVVSESGSAYTWAENAHEFRLTPWSNDPVTDAAGEAIYLRDEETGRFWSPTSLPARGDGPYTSRHGFGYSIFEHVEDGIESVLSIYVDPEAPVKWWVLALRNLSGRPRRLSATGFVEWVLGDLRARAAPHVNTSVDPETGAIFAENAYNAEFAGRTAFFHVDDPGRRVSGDRAEFVGRNGTLARPAAMRQSTLSGRVGGGLDPCAAIQVAFELRDGERRETVFRLGAGRDADGAVALLRRFAGAAAARASLEAVWEYWNHTLGAVQVDTPDAALNTLANGWLLYQTLASRLWGRSGAYQSGGAFGFRDQLQDTMALVHAEPQLVRRHLLLCASRQFLEGDVQHWWHPPAGRGVRTHCSDDFLWLPLATSRYVRATGDAGVLDQRVPFIDGRAVNPDEDSYYDLPSTSAEHDTLYGHCVRAISRGLRFGTHGLPLIGSGDWNDGMNLVGADGRGESVWLGFFLHAVLIEFAGLAARRGDDGFADRCQSEAASLRARLEAAGWDGEWYRRAYFDDGSPLGSSESPECQIDSIAQSWAVLSRAADPIRGRSAMDAVDRRLVRRDQALVRLLDPPFDVSALEPGYIKGYVPGVRENGGQYTHAAIWAAMAFAELGDANRAWGLWRLINPIAHGSTAAAIATYRVEPYVVAADVYAVAPHVGRGGWTWYTGSAAWMYRLLLESLLGVSLEGDRLRVAPCLPADWTGFTVHYRFRETVYHIAVRRARVAGEAPLRLDGLAVPGPDLPLVDDRQEHWAELTVPD